MDDQGWSSNQGQQGTSICSNNHAEARVDLTEASAAPNRARPPVESPRIRVRETRHECERFRSPGLVGLAKLRYPRLYPGLAYAPRVVRGSELSGGGSVQHEG